MLRLLAGLDFFGPSYSRGHDDFSGALLLLLISDDRTVLEGRPTARGSALRTLRTRVALPEPATSERPAPSTRLRVAGRGGGDRDLGARLAPDLCPPRAGRKDARPSRPSRVKSAGAASGPAFVARPWTLGPVRRSRAGWGGGATSQDLEWTSGRTEKARRAPQAFRPSRVYGPVRAEADGRITERPAVAGGFWRRLTSSDGPSPLRPLSSSPP